MMRTETLFPCQSNCGACCIAPSISSPIPIDQTATTYLNGKMANTPCIQLDEQYQCKLFGHEKRPEVCLSFQPCIEICGHGRAFALKQLTELEENTRLPANITKRYII